MIFQKPLDILIFGTGAVGSTLGWRLAQSRGARITVVCRSNYDAVKQYGIQMRTRMWGNGKFIPHRVARSTREVSDMEFDYVVCANKVSTSTDFSFTNELAHVVNPTTTLVSAQNGVGVESPLRHAFRQNTILSAVCYISCLQPILGIVHQVSNIRPHAFHIGIYERSTYGSSMEDQHKLERFVALEDKFKEIDDVRAERWTKQIFNGAWNPMTAISGLETHPLLASPYVGMVQQLATEIFNVAVKMGISLPANLPLRTIELAMENPSLAPSMLQDRRNNKPMEVESLCGNVIRDADRVQVSVPTVRWVYHMLLGMNRLRQQSEEPIHGHMKDVFDRDNGIQQKIFV